MYVRLQEGAPLPAVMPKPLPLPEQPGIIVDPPAPAAEAAITEAQGPFTARFTALASISHKFSETIAHDAALPLPSTLAESVRDSLSIVKTIFGKRSLEILVMTYLKEALGFQEIKNLLGTISSRTLSDNLRQMEALGLIQRKVIDGRPPRTLYSLTEAGITVARLGEPILLFLRLHRPAAPASEPPR